MDPQFPSMLVPLASQTSDSVSPSQSFDILPLAQLQREPHSSVKENTGYGQSKEQKETMNTRVDPLALFDKGHGIFYVLTRPREGQSLVSFEGCEAE